MTDDYRPIPHYSQLTTHYSPSHHLIPRPAPPLPRRPPRPKHVRRFAVDAVGRVHDQAIALPLVDAGGAEVFVHLRDLRGDVLPDDQVGGDVVARLVPRLEDRIDLAEG